MSKFKVGDRVQILANSNDHQYPIGSVVEVRLVNEDFNHFEAYHEDHGGWWVRERDVQRASSVLSIGTQLTKAEYMAFMEKTYTDLRELIRAKQSDYTAHSDDPFANFRKADDWGIQPFLGVMLRMEDKFQRLKSFAKAGKLEVVNESAEDALRDIIGYSFAALGMLSEKPDANKQD